MTHKKLFAFPLFVVALLALSAVASAQPTYQLITTIQVPGGGLCTGCLGGFDIGWVDSAAQRLYLTDRTTVKGGGKIDVIDTRTNTFLYSIPSSPTEIGFVGNVGPGKSGPNGVVFIPGLNQLYVGDGDSTVKIVDLAARAVVGIIPTGGKFRADELNYDPLDRIVMIANPNDDPPFVTFINVDTQTIVNQYFYPSFQSAANGGGLEQPVWDPLNDKFYFTVPASPSTLGHVDQFNPTKGTLEKSYTTAACSPAGLVITPNQHLMTSCGVVLNALSGNIFASVVLPGGGTDQIWYNPGDNRFYFGSPVNSVVDADTNRVIANLPGIPGGHTLSVDSTNNHVFVPVTGVGIMVFGAQ
jgi:hypothetical protein